jgi:molecular chaperone HscB
MAPNHFELLGLQPHFAVDAAMLEQRYCSAQAQAHPDRHAASGAAERLVSTEWTVRLNEAYAVLREPASRARYLLALHGTDPLASGGHDLPPEFLMAQLGWREAMERAARARRSEELERIDGQLAIEMRTYANQLAALIDVDHNFADAAAVARRLSFVVKVRADIATLLDEIDA